MLKIGQKQLDAMSHMKWNTYAPRIAKFLEDSLKEIWTTKSQSARDHIVSQAIKEGRRLGFRKLASVFKLAGLAAGSDGRFLQDKSAMAYLAESDNPDLQLERLITSMRIAEVLIAPTLDRSRA